VSPRLASEDALLELTEQAGIVLRAVGRMHLDARELSTLEDRGYVLVRFAAQVAVGAAPVSYLTTMAIGEEAGVTLEDLRGALVAITPVVGSARVIAALDSTDAAWRMAHAR
jgi:4-carboxymuconolactone decarboxylase